MHSPLATVLDDRGTTSVSRRSWMFGRRWTVTSPTGRSCHWTVYGVRRRLGPSGFIV